MVRILSCFFIFFLINSTLIERSGAQTPFSKDTIQTIPVDLTIRDIGRAEFDILSKDGKIYLPLLSIFNFIKVKVDYMPQTGMVEGFYLNRNNPYNINPTTNSYQISGIVGSISPVDYITTPEEFYLRQELFDHIFGLKMEYSPRALSVKFRTRVKLPIFLERERELARRRQQMFAPKEAEYTLPRLPWIFGGGRLDWNLTASASTIGSPRYDYSFRLGNQFLGGNLESSIHATVNRPITIDNVSTRLQYAFLDQRVLNQIVIGNIITTGFQPHNIFGAEITNRPAPRRLFFAEDIFSDFIGSNQTIDFYQRGMLMASQITPAEGQYQFTTLLPYGVSTFEVHAYDDFGLETVKRYRIDVPNSMVPPGEIQYSLTGGVFRYKPHTGVGNFSALWGINSVFTMGGGIDYLNYRRNWTKIHPSLSAIARLSNITNINAFVVPTAFSRAEFSMFYPSMLGGTVSYSLFSRNPFYNSRHAINEKTLSLSIPLSIIAGYDMPTWQVSMFAQHTLYSTVNTWNVRASLHGSFEGISFRGIQSLYWSDRTRSLTQNLTSLSIFARLPAQVFFRVTSSYDHIAGKIPNIRVSVAKNILKAGSIQLFVDRSFISYITTIGAQFIYYFPFAIARVGVTKVGGYGVYRFVENIRGSIGYADESSDFMFDNLNRVGLGGLLVKPFLDLNGNNTQDIGESDVVKARVSSSLDWGSGARMKYIPDIGFGLSRTLPYENYLISIDPISLEDPMWVPRYKSISIISEPDKFRVIELPIVIGGIVRGSINELAQDTLRPIAGMTVTIKSDEMINGMPVYVNSMTTFSTGEYEFIGVLPGSYNISISEDETAKLGRVAERSTITIVVTSKPEGDTISNVNFILR
ncbi:MAG: hypothetical protein QME52_11470 [Bacteroidota bacterium]|nr:hypothetical protein [Bacteroidota bacterium]